jgi:hypothetical protein
MPESAGSYVSENKYLISLYIFCYLFAGLAEKIVSRKSFFFNRLEFLAYDPALSGIRPLNLPTAIVIHWNTLHLGQAAAKRKQEGQSTPADLLAHISPLGWAHILLTGEYRWPKNR